MCARIFPKLETAVSRSLADDASDYFNDTVEFLDEVHGPVFLNQLERDCIDTPEFQRLFRVSQLGFVDLLYHSANHTRGIHSIGACAMAKRLVNRLNANTIRIQDVRVAAQGPGQHLPQLPSIAKSERCLVSLAGLLHDLPHGPLSHDIEKKTHLYGLDRIKMRSHYGPYPKHDDFKENPALYLMLFDADRSVLARVLRHHSPAFWRLLRHEGESDDSRYQHLRGFVEAFKKVTWPNKEKKHEVILPTLLFHLLVFEDLLTAITAPSVKIAPDFDRDPQDWGIGPPEAWQELHDKWYQPYRHEILGDTLSADLLDYLPRDARRLGILGTPDSKLLEYYVLVEVPAAHLKALTPGAPTRHPSGLLAQCAIDLNDYKRGVLRSERVNDVFRLLDLRHEIHEKAVHHRVVQSAVAMLARAAMLAGSKKPTLASLYGLGARDHALHGDDLFLRRLAGLPNPDERATGAYANIGQKLIERRVYRPVMILSGDEAYDRLGGASGSENSTEKDREETLRLLGAILDSPYFAPFFCLVLWCIERLLDHSLESVNALEAFLNDEVCRGDRLTWARGVVPRRVILWVTPYKQLHKDPAIVVRAGDCVGRIDELVKQAHDKTGDGPRLAPSVCARFEAGLRDAESRYAAMWKIHVFLSDGLFYTGGLAKLLPGHPCNSDPAAHKDHLQEAEACIIRAIHVAWNWWKTEGFVVGAYLGNDISDEHLRRLLTIFAAQPSQGRTSGSAVNLDLYLHTHTNDHCRDVRYRFDRPARFDEERSGLSSQALAAIKESLGLAKVDVEHLGHEEWTDIASHLAQRITDVKPDTRLAATEGDQNPGPVLRKIWFDEEVRLASRTEPQNATQGVATVPDDPGRGQPGRTRGANRLKGHGGSPQLRLVEATDPPVANSGDVPDSPTSES